MSGDFKQVFYPADRMVGAEGSPRAGGGQFSGAGLDFKDLTETDILFLLKYLGYLVEFLPDPLPKEFSQTTVRSDLEYLIDALEVRTRT